MNSIDLHVHSNCSDGTFSPKELVDYAIHKGLSAIALTDHDTVAGLDEAISYSQNISISSTETFQVIPGIELSTQYEKKDIHILGLYIDYKNTDFTEQLHSFLSSREDRNHKICLKLQEQGIPITYDKLKEAFPNCVITRAHYGQYLLKYNFVKSMNEAFDRYIGDRACCFVPREKVTPTQAIKMILEANGIPILAHPMLYHMSNLKLDSLVSQLKSDGLIGIEAIYSTHTISDERKIRTLAKKYDLLISGGSDFHGFNKKNLDLGNGYGSLFIPDSLLLNFNTYRKKRLI